LKSDKDILAALILREEEENPALRVKSPFERDPMGFILRKYTTLNDILTELMTSAFQDYLNAIFIVAPKPTTFKILLHNGQFFFLTFMGKAYQATVQGTNYYLMTIGEKERCMQAIARLLRFGSPLKTKGPEGAEQSTGDGTTDTGETGGEETGGAEAGGDTGGGDTGGGDTGGGETETLEESKKPLEKLILESLLKKNLNEASGMRGRKVDSAFTDGKKTLTLDTELYVKSKDKLTPQEKKAFFQNPQLADKRPNVALVKFKDDSGKTVIWAKYVDTKVPSMVSWKSDGTESPPGDYEKYGFRNIKAVSGISPSELIRTENPLGLKEIISTVSRNTKDTALINALKDLAKGNLPTIVGYADKLSAVRDNFGEIMAPVALLSGKNVGGSKEAEKDVLGGKTFSSAKVKWPMSKTTGLFDSYIVTSAKQFYGVSSKGAKGAPASLLNLADGIKKAEEDREDISRYIGFKRMVEIVKQYDSIEGIFELAKIYNPYEGYKKTDIDILKKEVIDYKTKGKTKPSNNASNLAKKLWKENRSKFQVKSGTFNVGYAILSVVAKDVCRVINDKKALSEEGANFSDSAKYFMNKLKFMQVYCNVKKEGDDVKVTSFDIVYTKSITGQVLLWADKNYFAGGPPKGKLSFKVPH
jgi:hypothetical protein